MALAAECYIPQMHPGAELLYPAAVPQASGRKTTRSSHHQQQQPGTQVACPLPAPAWAPTPPEKDYSIPLHVDCSVEYELPDCAKPPQGVKVEPLLMIHPAHFRRLDSLRRCPFVNNLPTASNAVPFELPPPPSEHHHQLQRSHHLQQQQPPQQQARRPSCQGAQPCRAAPRTAKVSPERNARRWSGAACCRNALGPCAGYAVPAPEPAPHPVGVDPFAPKEGDTLENSSFGKCPTARGRPSRHRSHPYGVPETGPLVDASATVAAAPDCDKTFDALQGNPLISPFHAKMFSSESVYQNYPIVMYK